jgi:hypothetical protein
MSLFDIPERRLQLAPVQVGDLHPALPRDPGRILGLLGGSGALVVPTFEVRLIK